MIRLSTAGTGIHTFHRVGAFTMDFAATEVDAAGHYKGYIRTDSGSEFDTFPKGEGNYIPIDIWALG